MFKTYSDWLKRIEIIYENQRYKEMLDEVHSLIKEIFIYFFRHFYSTFDSTNDWKKFLDFECENQSEIKKFYQENDLNTALVLYKNLLNYLENHPWVSEQNAKDFEMLIRVLHRQSESVSNETGTTSDEDLWFLIDNLDSMIKSLGLSDIHYEELGFPLQYYLVYSSIIANSEKKLQADDYKMINHDSGKILPGLLKLTFFNIYHQLPLNEKNAVFEILSPEFEQINWDGDIHIYNRVFSVINTYPFLKEAAFSFQNSLTQLVQKNKISPTKVSFHYITCLNAVVGYLKNPKTENYLSFAVDIKNRFIDGHQINYHEFKDLIRLGKRYDIADTVAQIEEMIYKIIEILKDNFIPYQTFQNEENEKQVEVDRRQEKIKAKSYFEVGCTKIKAYDFETAIKSLKQAIQYNPFEPKYYVYLETALLYANIEVEEDYLLKVMELNPDKDFYYFHRGEAEMLTGNYARAITHYNTAIRIEGNYFKYYVSRAEALEKLSKFHEALDDVEKALDLNPSAVSNDMLTRLMNKIETE